MFKGVKGILKNYENYSQINIEMHNFGSSNFIIQPDNVVQNFVYRSKYDESKPYIFHKSGFNVSNMSGHQRASYKKKRANNLSLLHK